MANPSGAAQREERWSADFPCNALGQGLVTLGVNLRHVGLAVAEGDFGVPECDNYMRKYLACIDSKVPETARPMLKQALDQSKAAWKQAASTPAGKAGLAAGCTQAEATAKQSMAAYGCEW